MDQDVEIRRSKISGHGLYSKRNFGPGELIIRFRGGRVGRDDINRRIDSGEEALDDPLQIGDGVFLDLEGKCQMINHSCDPNAVVAGEVDLIALREIKKGEEISFDYSATVGVGVEWVMKCSCGADNCRGEIGNALTIPARQLGYYYDHGGLQAFIRKQLGLVQ